MKIYDLSHPLSRRIPRYVGLPEFNLYTTEHHSKDIISAQELHCGTHSSTHMDSPWHFYGGNSLTIDQLPLHQLCGDCHVVSLPLSDWGEVTGDLLEKHASHVQNGDILLLNTGWHGVDIWSDEQRYIMKAPGVVMSGADWIVERGLKMIAVDFPAIDHPFQSPMPENRPDLFSPVNPIDRLKYPWYGSHYRILGANIPIVEHVGGQLDEINGKKVKFFAFPLKLVGGDASPVRAVAIEE